MPSQPLVFIARWSRRGAWCCLLLALFLPLCAVLADVAWGRDVLLLAPHDPSFVALNRSLWSAGEPVPDLYGSAMSEPTRVLLLSGQEILHPEEDPGLSLLPAAAGSRRPLQVRTVWWAVRLAEAGIAIATLALLGLTLAASKSGASKRQNG